RRRGLRICHGPQPARRVKEGVASDKEILVGPFGEAGRLAVGDREGFLYVVGQRIDLDYATVGGVRSDLRDRQKELAGAGIPLWLLGAICRVNAASGIEQDSIGGRYSWRWCRRLSQRAGDLVDLNEGAERRGVSIVDGEQNAVHRIESQFVRSGEIARSCGDCVHKARRGGPRD